MRNRRSPWWARLASALAMALAFAAGVAPRFALALTSDQPLRNQQHRAWGTRDGVPPQIYGMAQTSDGFLWLGTYRGLYRFDGVGFQSPAELGLPRFAGTPIGALSTDGQRLLVGFLGSGGALYADGRWQQFGLPQKVIQIEDALIRHDGSAWVLAIGKAWFLQGDHLVEALAQDDACASSRLAGFAEDGAGNLWLHSFDTAEVYEIPAGSRTCRRLHVPLHVHSLQVSGDLLWIGGTEGIWVTRLPQEATPPSWKCLSGAPVFIIQAVANGDLYADGQASLLRFANARAWARDGGATPEIERFDAGQGLAAPAIYGVTEDRQGDLWVAGNGTLERFRGSRFVWADLPGRHPGSAYLLSALPDGSLIEGNNDSTDLARIENDHGSTIATLPAGDMVAQIVADGQGGAYVATRSELFRLRVPAVLEAVATLGGPSRVTRAMTLDDHGSLWIDGGTGSTVSRLLANGSLQQPPVVEGLPASWEFRGGTADASGRIWFGTGDGIRVIEHGIARLWPQKTHGLDFGHISTLVARGGRLWAGGNLGVGLLDGDGFRKLTDRTGLPLGAITGIVETAQGDLWMNGPEATYRIAAAELKRVLPHVSGPVRIERFDALDGRLGVASYATDTPTLIEDARERLWMTTDAGVARIDTREIGESAPPRLLVDALDTGQQVYRSPGPIRLPALSDHFTIRYVATELAKPEKIRFRYRLAGLDEAWRDAGDVRLASYSNLGPGHYVFRLSSTDVDGEWSPAEATLAIDIAAAWYQTWLFKALCIIAAAALLWRLHQLRLGRLAARLREHQHAELMERGRIARELHDTLLQDVQGVSMLVSAVAARLPEASAERQRLAKAIDAADRALTAGRDRVLELRAGEDAVELDELVSGVALSLRSSGIDFDSRIEGVPRVLKPEISIELRRVLGEAARNIIQHAGASRVRMQIRFSRGLFELKLADNGQGVEDDVAARGKPGHWGLTGMRERVERLDGQFAIRSRRGEGFEIEIQLKAAVAYA